MQHGGPAKARQARSGDRLRTDRGAARRAGAAEIVATDLAQVPLDLARKIGADRTINMKDELDGLAGDKGYFDVPSQPALPRPRFRSPQ